MAELGHKEIKNNCGECTLCCEVLPIPEIHKPESILCKNCVESSGCSIYNSRPDSCKNFNCVYIQSEDMDENLRPDECGVMFEMVTTKIYVGTEHLKNIGAYKNSGVQEYIKRLNNEGISVVISSFTNTPNEFLLAKGHSKEVILKIITNAYENII